MTFGTAKFPRWVKAGILLGRRKGLTDDDMICLVRLSPNETIRREYVALEMARNWTLSRGEVIDEDISAEFESFYSCQERHDILAVIVTMDFINRFLNTINNRPDTQRDD